MHEHLEFLRPYYEQAWRRRGARRDGVAFGIQGSGQQRRRRCPTPGVFRERRADGGGARLRLDLGRRPHLVPQPDPRRRRRALHVRGASPSGSRSAPASCCCRCGHPSVVAKEFASLDYVSGGRVDPRRRRRRRGREGLRGGRRRRRASAARATDEAMRALRELFARARRELLRAVLLASRASRSSRGRRSRAARRSGSAAARRRRSGARPTLGDGWIPIWVSAERFARRAARSCPDARRSPAVALPALVGDEARVSYEHLRQRYARRLLRARRRPLLRRRHAGGVRGAGARVRRRGRAARRLQHRCEPEDARAAHAEVARAAAR